MSSLQPAIRAQRELEFATFDSRGLRLNVEPLGIHHDDRQPDHKSIRNRVAS